MCLTSAKLVCLTGAKLLRNSSFRDEVVAPTITEVLVVIRGLYKSFQNLHVDGILLILHSFLDSV